MNNVCSLLWAHATLTMDGRIAPCCRFNELEYTLPQASAGLSAAINGEVFTDIRNRMLAGEKIQNCAKCWKQEESTGASLRTIFNDRYPTAITDNKLRFLEIGLSTHCNLACRMCSPAFSSKWAVINNPNDSVNIGYESDIRWFDADLSDLDLVKIVGGEPMMASQHAEFIDLLNTNDISEMTVVYFTNGTVKPSEKILEFWSKLKHVIVNISIDGIEFVNEYQRPGATWDKVVDTIDFYKTLEIDVRIHTVVTPLNIKYLHQLYEWIDGEFDHTIDTVEEPHHLGLRNLETDHKNQIREYINNNIDNKSHAEQLLHVIDNEPRDGETYSIKDIMMLEAKLDNYFNQETIL